MNPHPFDPVQAMRDVQNFGEEGGVVPVIDVASTSTFLNPEDMEKSFKGEIGGCYPYSRHSNPTVQYFSQKIAAMENTEAAVGVASGMAAINATIELLAGQGSHILCSRVVYGGTYAYMKEILPRRGVEVEFADFRDLAALEKKIKKNTKLLYTEVMSNPLLEITDLEALARLKNRHKLQLVIDNTFTPLLVTPKNWGADFVIHSCTKFISGASDLLAGAIATTRENVDKLCDINTGPIMLTGPTMDARVAHELYTRLDHLAPRMKAHSETAMHFAKKMLDLKLKVHYPGLENHPGHKTLQKLSNRDFGFGGLLTLDCGDRETAMALAFELQKRRFGLYAVSLGFSRTLITCPSTSTSSEVPEQEQREIGITPGLLRISVGYAGNAEVLFDRFLEAARAVKFLR